MTWCIFHLPQLAGAVFIHDSGCESLTGLWRKCWEVISPKMTGIGRQNSVLFGLVELPTFVKGMSFTMFCFLFVCLFSKVRTTCKSAWRHVKQEWKPPVERYT